MTTPGSACGGRRSDSQDSQRSRVAGRRDRVTGTAGNAAATGKNPHDPYVLQCKIARGTLWYMGKAEGRRSQLLRGVLDLCLLAVMSEGPAYGYEMTKRLRARGLSIVGEGSIYPLLGRLERDGLVKTHRAASNGGPPRKYYSLSPDGERGLLSGVKEWQAARDAIDGALDLVKVEVSP